MWSRVLSGRSFTEVLAYLLPLCNEDTSPVTPALIISGCDIIVHTCRIVDVRYCDVSCLYVSY
ncbi:hypothetical protein HanXRQr2_Chr09g0389621 [Helianthus annuus]|uniref:Uncharacterized protein n=1 Tax=Helianthus annuus TaxID=4232 RepID=A0A9K3I659_HELAN|nr:hypothetical protein HanXRQr2_Chr09g0389621 [Helianthus annuus]KAJ0893244.1 hypothetical protein HanPSC8_Chr09g0375441 [Helianthus annuus]